MGEKIRCSPSGIQKGTDNGTGSELEGRSDLTDDRR